MIVDDVNCICGGCPKDASVCLKNDHCSIQRSVILVQNLLRIIAPDDVIIECRVEKCPSRILKEVKE